MARGRSFRALAFAAAVAASVALAPSGAIARRSPLIYRGEEVSSNEYPFEALLCSTGKTSQPDTCVAYCTGSLVSPGVILTAAHCFDDHTDQFYANREMDESWVTESYRVAIGVDTSGPHSLKKTVGVKKIVVGDYFNFQGANWDLALVFLEVCKEENEPIKMLAAADGEADQVGQALFSREVQIVGWGETERSCVTDGPDYQYLGDKLHVMTYYPTPCFDLMSCQGGWGYCDPAKQMCMTRSDISTCLGDSGGPIFLEVDLPPAKRGSQGNASTTAYRSTASDGGDEGGVQLRVNSSEAGEDEEEEAEAAATRTLVQVGLLSGGEVIQDTWSQGFRDESTGALVPAYTQWLKKHLVADECLERAGLEVEDLFVDASVLAGDWD